MISAAWTAFVRDLWVPLWPNLAASAIWTLPVLAWHHRRLRRHITAEIRRNAAGKDGTEAPT